MSWELYHGNIEDSLQVLHKCDVRSCVNPDHLFLGTHDDNMADMVNKGRVASGERNNKAKLTEEDVQIIREWVSDGWTRAQCAEVWGVSPSTISDISLRKTWTNLADRRRAAASQ